MQEQEDFRLTTKFSNYQFHTPLHPFCFDPKCTCHEDMTLIAFVAENVRNGLLTPSEATRTIKGEMI
jgi:hypothetical protein